MSKYIQLNTPIPGPKAPGTAGADQQEEGLAVLENVWEELCTTIR
jgi:hypothetical protein